MKRSDFLQRLISVAIFGKLPISTLITKRKVYLLQCFVAGFKHYRGMELLNEMGKAKAAGAFGSPEWLEAVDIYLRMLAPVCPHISEELWQRLGKPYSVHQQPWPKLDEEAAKDEEITLIVQVNGKLRDRLIVSPSISETEAQALALASPAVQQRMAGKPARKVIVVPGKLVNIVI